jgi:LmbE family N-acetylglucosaminyl deacetylase
MKRILVLAPHPDDEAIGCGGAMVRHAKAGDAVRVVFLTSGEKGGHGRTEQETIRLREAEARKAGRLLRVKSVEFWREPDGALSATAGAVKRLRAELEQWKPDTLYVTHDREMHPDHQAAVRIVQRALKSLPAKHPRPDVLMYEIWTPLQQLDEIVDISLFLRKKLAAVRAYRSQCAVVGFVEAVRGLNRYRGEMHSWPGGDYAEVFARLTP